MTVLGVPRWKRTVMYWAVRWFGRGNIASVSDGSRSLNEVMRKHSKQHCNEQRGDYLPGLSIEIFVKIHLNIAYILFCCRFILQYRYINGDIGEFVLQMFYSLMHIITVTTVAAMS